MAKYEDITIFSGEGEDFAPNILTFGIKGGVRGEDYCHAFEEYQGKISIYISTTSFPTERHVHLRRETSRDPYLWSVPTKLAQTAVRISLDDDNDMGQVEQFLTIFKQVYAKTQKSEIARFKRLNIMKLNSNLKEERREERNNTNIFQKLWFAMVNCLPGQNRMRFINKLRNNIKDVLSSIRS